MKTFIALAVSAGIFLFAAAPLAFARDNAFRSKVCTDTKWCIQTPSCYETEANREALKNWYIDNC